MRAQSQQIFSYSSCKIPPNLATHGFLKLHNVFGKAQEKTTNQKETHTLLKVINIA